VIDLLLKILGFLLKLIVLAVTGEWPSSDSDAVPTPPPTPAQARGPARAKRPPPVPRGELAEEGGAKTPGTGEERVLADVETCLQALAQPVVDHLEASSIPLAPLAFVAVGDDSAPADEADGAEQIRVRVGSNFGEHPERWVFLGRQVGRTLFDAVPGWSAELYARHRLPPSLFLPPGHGAYDADTARAALGVWLPELFADVYAAYVLGPAYAVALASSLARPKQPMEICMARGQGRWLSPVVPSVVRMHAVLAVLTQLGQHDWERIVRERWEAAHGAPESLYLPLADGRLMAIPLEFTLGELDPVLAFILEEPQAALAGETWLDVPGLAYLHGAHAQVVTATRSLARGEALDVPAGIAIAAAVFALDSSPGARQLVASALAGSIRGADTLDAAPNAFSLTRARPVHASGGLGAAFRDPHAVREALELGAALAPLKPRRFRS